MFRLAGTADVCSTPSSFSEECYLETSGHPEFHNLAMWDSWPGLSVGVKAASILFEVWKRDFIEVKTNGSPQGGKLFYSDATEKAARLWRGTGKSALGLGRSVPLLINQLTLFS